MPITKDTIRSVAKTCCLELTEQEVDQFMADFQSILDTFSKLNDTDTTNVPPAFHPLPIADVLREDIAKQGCTPEQALSLSKHTSKGYFVGPKTL
ncbi:Asp-tRNA(Asn)/Glu-tRNA(Gln) amidotransferase subunit GatC [Candidatus Woesearchaeota archaeon]|nr:Asp-tRNA(Asn)/Glu-tRNA(Gln) amidotransferase subunit GatC [Candidatus Woesearchaeota archaeon]